MVCDTHDERACVCVRNGTRVPLCALVHLHTAVLTQLHAYAHAHALVHCAGALCCRCCAGFDVTMAWKSIRDPALLVKRRHLAAAMAKQPIKLILDQKLNQKCGVVYLITEVTWPELHEEFARHGLKVFWKQGIEPGIEQKWPFEALAYLDWMMAVESDYFLMFEKGISSFDLFALMHRRFTKAPTFEYIRGPHVECEEHFEEAM